MLTHTQRSQLVGNVALHLAPSFRDKLDYSDPGDHDKLADYAFLAAEAFVKKQEQMNAAALKLEQDELKAAKEKLEAKQ